MCKNNKGKKTAIDALSIAFINKMFGKFDTQLEQAFMAKGIKVEHLTNLMGEIIKS